MSNGPEIQTPKDADPADGTPKADPPKSPAGDTPSGDSGLSASERAELERLRSVHAEEKKWESRSKANLSKLRELAESMGISRDEFNPAEFDPKSEVEKLRAEIESERIERQRTDVARTTGVDPKYVKGKTLDEMTAAANEYKADLQAAIDKALADKAPPADRITAGDAKGTTPVTAPTQLTQADLDKMSTSEILKAKSEGRLNKLLGIS